MQGLRRFIPLVVIAAACDNQQPTGLAPGRASVSAVSQNSVSSSAVASSTTGGGKYLLQDTYEVQFAFSATGKGDGKVAGNFHQRLDADGLLIDIHGSVTCVATDPTTNRAWVGGVVTKNRSTDPAFLGLIHQPGRHVWFRVVDYGEGQASPPDRTTFLGFEGAAGIITSEDYCRLRIWPADDARTWPVIAGNIQVR